MAKKCDYCDNPSFFTDFEDDGYPVEMCENHMIEFAFNDVLNRESYDYPQ